MFWGKRLFIQPARKNQSCQTKDFALGKKLDNQDVPFFLF
jgi:hypothetical protein